MRSKTVAIFVDGSNLFAANRMLGTSTDYKKLLTYFGGNLFRAAYFTALPPNGEESNLRPMVDWLSYNGWTVYSKDVKEFIDPVTKQVKVKGNMDVEISVIAMECAPYITDVVLFSGDGDFRFLVEALQRSHGVRVTVVSTVKSRPPMIADELRRQADVFLDLVDIYPDTKREDQVQPSRQESKFKFGGSR